MTTSKRIGLVQAYTGEGKGKTTAAIGLAVRACGSGMTVSILQFLKEGGPTPSSEIAPLRDLLGVSVEQYGRSSIYFPKPSRKQVMDRIAIGFTQAEHILKDGSCDLLILDEVLVAVSFGLADEQRLIGLINTRPDSVEVVLTGRGLTTDVSGCCDLITEMRPVKQPYSSGITARRGSEY